MELKINESYLMGGEVVAKYTIKTETQEFSGRVLLSGINHGLVDWENLRNISSEIALDGLEVVYRRFSLFGR